ncbi:YHS domain-containing protein [Sulfurirhabdus autotrophica]|nr:YHS domain-containing protein [Sulfurirhabdus autotrophica]
MNDSTRDRVCGMQVSLDSFAMEHLGIQYAFCSQQCQDRFKANPYLYIGVPGEKAPKQKGLEIIKQRRFSLEQPMNDSEATILSEELGAMMGIKHIEVASNIVSITYDLLEATAEQIEERIGQIGLRLGEGWTERLQRGFVHYFEECEVGNLQATPRQGHH